MSFISIKYFVFLISLFVVLNLIKKVEKKYLLILSINYGLSLMYGFSTFLTLLLITIYSYWISRIIIKDNKLLVISIIPIVAILIDFKILGLYKSIVVPIGLSFYALQIISYLIDICKDNKKFNDDFFLYAAAISFFPALSSGPIEKVDKLVKRLKNDLVYNSIKVQQGIQLICEGLFKKLVIANRVVEYVDKVYASPNSFNGLTILISIVLYSIQIYCDFSAYSDLAIGSAKILGIDLVNNFDNPYFSKSIKEFWRRWHISLSTWLKDYIYIPLGGNKKGTFRKTINIIITFIVSGLWHGLNITYLIWGLIHGLLNAFPTKNTDNKFVNIFKTIITFSLVSFSWIFFRASTLENAFGIIAGLFTRFSLNISSITESVLLFTNDINAIPYSLTTFIMIIVLIIKEFMVVYHKDKYNENLYLCLIIVCTILFGTNGSGAFIYQGF